VKIHEYQARELFSKHGIPVNAGAVAVNPGQAREEAERIGGRVVVKAQVHVGGRGKAGGVKLAENPTEAEQRARDILGMDIKGLTVEKVLVADAVDIASEAYVGVIVDRATRRPVVMVSSAGGVDIEEVARETPEKIVKLAVDPLLGLTDYQARRLAFALYDDPKVAKQATPIIQKLYEVFAEEDCSLAEINPLVVTPEGSVIAIDAKVLLDDNGFIRHPGHEGLRDLASEDSSEMKAKSADLSFVKLSGNIGCCVNGAGLAMATMDMIKLAGGEPANFLDIGGSSSPEKVISAMSIILRDEDVSAICFNIFGGITRCDDVANGIRTAVTEMKPRVPIVVRLTGTNEAQARDILSEVQGIEPAATMREAIDRAVALGR
jgi:succinyl-CoA synthetase beta subunit